MLYTVELSKRKSHTIYVVCDSINEVENKVKDLLDYNNQIISINDLNLTDLTIINKTSSNNKIIGIRFKVGDEEKERYLIAESISEVLNFYKNTLEINSIWILTNENDKIIL